MRDNDVDTLALRREARSYFAGRSADETTTASASSSRNGGKAFDGIVEAICVSCIRQGLTEQEVIQEIVDACRKKLTVELIQQKMSDSSFLLRQGDARGPKESGEQDVDVGSSAENDKEKPVLSLVGLTPVEKLVTKLQRQRQQHAMLVETMRMQQRQTEAVVQQQQRQIEKLQRKIDKGLKKKTVANARASVKQNDAAKDDEDDRSANEEGRERGKEKKRKRRGAGQPKAKKRPLRALCQREGCTVRPQRPSDLFCSQHKPRLCRVEGCGQRNKVGGVCYRHGAKRRKLCSVEGCTSQAQKKGLCQRHALERGLVHFCAAEGCRKQVKEGGYCARHEAAGGFVHYPEERCVRVDAVEEGVRGGYGEMQYSEPQYVETRYEETQYGEAQYSEAQYAETNYGETNYGKMVYGDGGVTAEMMGSHMGQGVGDEEESVSEEER